MTTLPPSPKTKSARSCNRCFIFLAFVFLIGEKSFSQMQLKTKPAAAANKSPDKNNFVMCEVMPGIDVAAKAPFTLPFTGVAAWPVAGIKTGCRYTFKNNDEEAGIAIGLTDLGSNKNAFASYKNAYQASKDLWEEDPTQVIVLKDTGFFSGKDECGLRLHLGKYVLEINFKGQFPDVSTEQKQQSAILLAEMVINRLRYLWKE